MRERCGRRMNSWPMTRMSPRCSRRAIRHSDGLRTGSPWRDPPDELGPWDSVFPWRKGGTHRNGLGRSRGGFTTKLHARSNAEGLAIGFAVTPGQAHDATGYDDLMDDGAPDPETMIGDKGYDSDAIRDDLEER